MSKKIKRVSSPISAFKDTQHKKLFLEKLIIEAKKMRAVTVAEAHGTCLTMSLEFCLLAEQFNVPVELVMWPIKNEPVFCDHWAVRINQNQVIDLTRIQVDNTLTSNVIFDLSDYPDNFMKPRFYSISPLVAEYRYFKNSYAGKLPPDLIKNLRKLMLRQDLDDINHFKNFSGMTTVLMSYLKFRFHFYLSQLEERLHKRRDSIKNR